MNFKVLTVKCSLLFSFFFSFYLYNLQTECSFISSAWYSVTFYLFFFLKIQFIFNLSNHQKCYFLLFQNIHCWLFFSFLLPFPLLLWILMMWVGVSYHNHLLNLFITGLFYFAFYCEYHSVIIQTINIFMNRQKVYKNVIKIFFWLQLQFWKFIFSC